MSPPIERYMRHAQLRDPADGAVRDACREILERRKPRPGCVAIVADLPGLTPRARPTSKPGTPSILKIWGERI
jgi:hypothetical protein